jgi:hypothetical protein
VERRELRDRPHEPARHRGKHGDAEQRAPAHHQRRKAGTYVDERRSRRKDRADQEADRNRNLKPRQVVSEENAGRSDGVQAKEPAGRHEREREKQHARVAASICSLPGGVAQRKRQGADEPEDDEVSPVVLEVRVELFANAGATQGRRAAGWPRPRSGDESGRTHSPLVRAWRPARGVVFFVNLPIRVCCVDDTI